MHVVWQLYALHLSDNRTLISGVILNSTPYRFGRKANMISNMLKIVGSYFTRTAAYEELCIESNGEILHCSTNHKGAFSVVANSLHKEELTISLKKTGSPLKILQSYPFLFEMSDGPVDVISDIDDTIIVSHSVHFIKRVANLVLKTPQKRTVINFTKEMLTYYKSQGARVSYVSKSEGNLFGLLTTFINHSALPNGVLFLTPYLHLKQLLNPNKQKEFKSNRIGYLIENTFPKRYVLIGDDSQQDMEVYAQMIDKFPNRIDKVYIHQTKQSTSNRKQQMMDHLISKGVEVVYFKSSDEIGITKT